MLVRGFKTALLTFLMPRAWSGGWKAGLDWVLLSVVSDSFDTLSPEGRRTSYIMTQESKNEWFKRKEVEEKSQLRASKLAHAF